jgi:hypothetical protein
VSWIRSRQLTCIRLAEGQAVHHPGVADITDRDIKTVHEPPIWRLIDGHSAAPDRAVLPVRLS